MAGGGAALELRRHLLPHKLSRVRFAVHSHSPDAHQEFALSTPDLCSGVH